MTAQRSGAGKWTFRVGIGLGPCLVVAVVFIAGWAAAFLIAAFAGVACAVVALATRSLRGGLGLTRMQAGATLATPVALAALAIAACVLLTLAVIAGVDAVTAGIGGAAHAYSDYWNAVGQQVHQAQQGGKP